ncbi:MAG: hypothetical protein JJT99_15390 [Rhodobacteraceae bacterium]|nr:hypothetical protein [Paracoccaceae bacterium]
MPDDHLQRFDDVVERMKRQQIFGLSCYAFLSGIVDDPARHAKYNNSYAGHALELCIRSVQTGLVLFCSRHWDKNDDCQSLPTAIIHAERAIDKIVERHREFFATNCIERDADEFKGYLCDLSGDVEAVGASEIRKQIRVLRTEHYSHLIKSSKDREKAAREDSFFDVDGLTVNSLLEFSRQTIELSNRFVYLKERLSPDFHDRVASQSKYYDKFWDNLPIFSEVEGSL